jgi:UDP-N-acetylmuramoylalanine--D-glutamate ligase
MNIGMERTDDANSYSKENYLMFKEGDDWKRLSRKNIPLKGQHNMMNAMAAVLAARTLGVSWDAISHALPGFKNVPHRLEFVDEIGGVQFFNDSKATNVDAVWYALESFDQTVIWIAGGIDKGNDYDQISEMVRKKVKAMVSLGTDNKKLHNYFGTFFMNITETDSMFRAVEIAYSHAESGDVVLLSPACASFDLFKNYEARGDKFKEAVEALKNKEEINEKFMA